MSVHADKTGRHATHGPLCFLYRHHQAIETVLPVHRLKTQKLLHLPQINTPPHTQMYIATQHDLGWRQAIDR